MAGSNTQQLNGLYKPASTETIDLIRRLNQDEQCTFLLPTKFISAEAGQVGFLLNECFRQQHNTHSVIYRTFFGNSRYEALQGAIKISRHKVHGQKSRKRKDVFVHDPTRTLRLYFDPLKNGDTKALVPGVKFYEQPNDILIALKKGVDCIAVILSTHIIHSLEHVNKLFLFCRKHNITTILVRSA